ncbi:hypothetical protein ACA910_007120 [Epithemia clementina (nom. ined.)]
MKSTTIGSKWNESISIAVHKDPKNQFGDQIQDYKKAVENGSSHQQDDACKNYGKIHWATGTIVLAYLVITLVAHGHLTKDHPYITIFQAEFNSLEVWGAAIGCTILTLIHWYSKHQSNFENETFGSTPYSTRTTVAQDTESCIFPTNFGVQICYLLFPYHQVCGATTTKELPFYWMTYFILIGNKLWGATTTNVLVTFCNKLWGAATISELWGDITNATIVTIGNNLWGDTTNATAVTISNNLWGETNKVAAHIPLFDTDCIFLAHHDWGVHVTQNGYFDSVCGTFHHLHTTRYNTQSIDYLDGIPTSQIDWGGTNSLLLYLFYQFNPCHLLLRELALTRWIMYNLKKFSNLCTLTMFCIFEVVWATLKDSQQVLHASP